MPKILIFDDDPFLAKAYIGKYRQLGLETAYYQSPGDDPVQTVLDEKPDIISMDVVMPDMNGFDAVRALKADKRTRAIPVFFLTNLGQPGEASTGRQLGAIDYFVKTQLTPTEVVERVRQLLNL